MQCRNGGDDMNRRNTYLQVQCLFFFGAGNGTGDMNRRNTY